MRDHAIVGPLLAQLRRDLRGQWRSLLALAVLVGLVGGVVLASTMAARRTASAYSRFIDVALAEDINIGTPGINDPAFPEVVSAIEGFPEVAAVGPISSQELLSAEEGLEFFALGGLDDRVGTTINRPKILDGRAADPEAEDEVTVNRSMAAALDLVPGDTFTLYGFDGGNADVRQQQHVALEDGRRQVFTVTGISLYPNEVVPTAPLDDAPRVYLTPAQVQAHLAEGEEFAFVAVRLRRGAADAPAFRAHFAELLAGFGVPEDAVPLLEASERTSTVQRAIRPQAQALGAFALLVGLTGLVVLGQAYARQLSVDAEDRRVLWALGFTRRQLALTALLRIGLSVTVGAALAVVIAVLAAPRALVGPAHLADPDPGVWVDGSVAVVGAAAVVVLLMGRAALALRTVLPTARASARSSPAGLRRAHAVTEVTPRRPRRPSPGRPSPAASRRGWPGTRPQSRGRSGSVAAQPAGDRGGASRRPWPPAYRREPAGLGLRMAKARRGGTTYISTKASTSSGEGDELTAPVWSTRRDRVGEMWPSGCCSPGHRASAQDTNLSPWPSRSVLGGWAYHRAAGRRPVMGRLRPGSRTGATSGSRRLGPTRRRPPMG